MIAAGRADFGDPEWWESALATAATGRAHVKIGGLIRDPRQKSGQIGMGAQGFRRSAMARQIGIAEGGVQRAMADRVNRHHHSAPPAFGHGMVPFHPDANGPRAQPAVLAAVAQAGRPRRAVERHR